MNEETNVPDDLASAAPAGDDSESRTNALSAQIERIVAETKDAVEKSKREELAKLVRMPLHKMLGGIGFEEPEFKQAERVLGGLQNFRKNDSGELEMLYAGEWMLAQYVLPDDPRLAGLLKEKSSTRSDASKLQREIEQTETRLNELKSRRRYPSDLTLEEVGKLSNRLPELRRKLAELTAEKKTPGVVDKSLVVRRNALIRERDAICQQYRRHPSDHLLVEHDKLTKQITAISAKIAAQQAG